MNYIGFENSLNITNPSTADVYDFMAGGLFDGYYAGSYAYNALNLPTPDLRSFFINQSFSLTAGLLELNEDFCEFVLMPMQIMILRDEKDYSFNALVQTIEKIIEHKDSFGAKSQRDKTGFSRSIDGNGYIKQGSFKNFAMELMHDSFMENQVEELGYSMFGPMGGAIAGMIYDGLVNHKFEGANIAEAVYGEFKSLALNTAIKSGFKALGTSTGLVGSFGLTVAINALVNELFETVTGLDNSFGFGGDLVGFMKDKGVYQEKLGFVDGVKNLFGALDFYRTVDYTGNTVGYVENNRMYEYTNYPTVSDVIKGRQFEKLESVKAEGFKELGTQRGKYNSKFSTGVSLDRYGNMSFDLSMRRDVDVGFVGKFQDVLDDITRTSVFGVAPSLDIKSITESTVVTQIAISISVTTATTSIQGSDKKISSAKESFSRNKDGGFSFSNTQAGNLVEAMGKVGFGKGSLSIADMAKAMRLADKIGKEKSGSNRSKEKSKPARDRTPTEHSRAQRGRSYRARQSMREKNKQK
ncbi:hypothetical protein [Campylobacter sp. RM16192]|uniref:hypothetical protein n=1 Tax=Campylobacter sp. RM16192 TaxID=1660080 RepID=UPI001451A04F|nr:hypothetical protein [Campylobacter sp. RM16192]QCD52788.1 hypothetical protein CDOMC_1181 [Campylobacter sp. RM16192]